MYFRLCSARDNARPRKSGSVHAAFSPQIAAYVRQLMLSGASSDFDVARRILGRMMFNARRSIRPVFGAQAMATALKKHRSAVQRWEGGETAIGRDQLEDYLEILVKRGFEEKEAKNILDYGFPKRRAAKQNLRREEEHSSTVAEEWRAFTDNLLSLLEHRFETVETRLSDIEKKTLTMLIRNRTYSPPRSNIENRVVGDWVAYLVTLNENHKVDDNFERKVARSLLGFGAREADEIVKLDDHNVQVSTYIALGHGFVNHVHTLKLFLLKLPGVKEVTALHS